MGISGSHVSIYQLHCIDLEVAMGSAVKIASINNIDARCPTRYLGDIEADMAVTLSMSVSQKNIFFDRKTPGVKFDEPPAEEK